MNEDMVLGGVEPALLKNCYQKIIALYQERRLRAFFRQEQQARWSVLLSVGLIMLTVSSCSDDYEREVGLHFNRDWKFILDEVNDWSAMTVDDANWETIHLPHDWSIAFAPDSLSGEGCTAYLPGGVGWYRKHFTTAASDDEVTYLVFDGVYNNSEVFLNGQKIGERPYGYVPFFFDLTEHLKAFGRENILAVKVDRTRYADSRWYSGSGIYRKVALKVVPAVHIPVWGTFVSTPTVSEESAEVQTEVQLINTSDRDSEARLHYTLINPQGQEVMTYWSDPILLTAGDQQMIQQRFTVPKPALWDIGHPNLYNLVVKVQRDNETIQEETTVFGIRTFSFDAEKGFVLNGKNRKIKGVCLHHDGGLVGAAVPRGVWQRRLQILKDAGCNAVRISHNPGSQQFLDLCDEMGFLVQDEFFDEWDYPKDKRLNMYEQSVDEITRGYTEHFQEWAEQDLKNTVLAHRNHPSIIQWSIGNEIEWTYPRSRQATGFFDNLHWSGNYFWSQPPYTPQQIRQEYEKLPPLQYEIGATAQKLADWTRSLDTTRPVIANCILPSASYETGYAQALDIIGFSYRRVMYDYGRDQYPEIPLMGTENLGQYHEWKAVMERPFVAGTFLWTGIDYLGESNGQYPRKASPAGLLDLAGFTKPSYHMMKSLWSAEPHLYISTQRLDKTAYKLDGTKVVEQEEGAWQQALWTWHEVNEYWNYEDQEMIVVEVISNCPVVELFLDDRSMGEQRLADFPDHIYKWAIPYKAGKLVAKGTLDGNSIETQLATANMPVGMEITVDKTQMLANGEEVSHIIVQLIDENQNPVRHKDIELEFVLAGKSLHCLGIDNGSPRNTSSFQVDQLKTHNGRALMIVQATMEPGEGSITVNGPGIASKTITLEVAED